MNQPTSPGEIRGMFVAFEGGDGSGKSTQVRLLAEHLRVRGIEVVETREPGGTPAAEAIRAVVLDPVYEGLDSRTEALLFAASRAEHVARVVRPALNRGVVVLCDRYIDSSVVYQGVGRGLGMREIADLSAWATEGLKPDLTVLLDVPSAVSASRLTTHDRIEAATDGFHERVRQAYLDLAEADPTRYLVLDAAATIDELASAIGAAVDKRLQEATP